MTVEQSPQSAQQTGITTRSPTLAAAAARHASVSMIVTPDDVQRKTLIIKRVRRQDDAWSGQYAFPGGFATKKDAALHDTAIRETFEELGLVLRQEHIRTQFKEHTLGIPVTGFVFETRWQALRLEPSEVSECLELPLQWVHRPERQMEYTLANGNKTQALMLQDAQSTPIWGMTLRLLKQLALYYRC